MKLDGFGIAGFRSFGQEMVYVPDLTKVNIFIGKNNSGKSNIIRFCKHLSQIKLGQRYKGFDERLDYCLDSNGRNIRFAFQIKKESLATGGIYTKIENFLPGLAKKFPEWKDSIWGDFSVSHLINKKDERKRDLGAKKLAEMIFTKYNPAETNDLAAKHLGYREGDPQGRSMDLALVVRDVMTVPFQVHAIEAFRQITEGEGDSTLNGRGLIRELRKIQSPTLDGYQEGKTKFATINKFLGELLGEEEAFLEIPAEVDEILVSIKQKILPLDSLGTGIHELIILAAAVTIIDDSLFCIEEPEIHIHPALQKKFVRYIQENTQNQYLITTHSNAFFDIPGVNIYHCRLAGDHTSCELVVTDHERGGVISDLGYRPSDLLQANYVIWVEGPSDRIYLNHWIRGAGTALEEGLHYSIMFYGGRLLSHLSFDSDEIEDFVRLCKLNRNAAIIIDSDKNYPQTSLNETKKRVIDDFRKNSCFVWVTDGREIENYVSETTINSCVKEVHPRSYKRIKWDKYGNLTKLGNGKSIAKVAVAKKIASENPDYSVLDLSKRIQELIGEIKRANS